MRRLLLVVLTCLGLAAAPSYASAGGAHGPHVLPPNASIRATQALATAQDALHGHGAMKGQISLALASLRASYTELSPRQKRTADEIFARPTDGANDPNGDGYTTTSVYKSCSTHFCVHYVKSTGDTVPLTDTSPANGIPDQVDRTKSWMEQVWKYEIGTLGFRAPASDGTKGGGSGLVDVYLKDETPVGAYGYCAPETQLASYPYRASGYCVLDNDFVGYGSTPPVAALQVTGGHEFFHDIQFNYDYDEDHWIMEATATWMEDHVADWVNDNRQYLPEGQLRRNGVALDSFEVNGFAQYGNWPFFELLSQTYGVGAVKALWQRMDSTNPSADQYSSQAVATYLAAQGTSLRRFYAFFAGSSVISRRVWQEGAAGSYPSPPMAASYTLSRVSPKTGTKTTYLNHLANRDVQFTPSSGLTGTWRLKISVNGPQAAAPGIYVIVFNRDGSVTKTNVTPNSSGDATVYVPFSPGSVSRVTLTLANGSAAMHCGTAGQSDPVYYSCYGSALYNSQPFSYSGTLTQ